MKQLRTLYREVSTLRRKLKLAERNRSIALQRYREQPPTNQPAFFVWSEEANKTIEGLQNELLVAEWLGPFRWLDPAEPLHKRFADLVKGQRKPNSYAAAAEIVSCVQRQIEHENSILRQLMKRGKSSANQKEVERCELSISQQMDSLNSALSSYLNPFLEERIRQSEREFDVECKNLKHKISRLERQVSELDSLREGEAKTKTVFVIPGQARLVKSIGIMSLYFMSKNSSKLMSQIFESMMRLRSDQRAILWLVGEVESRLPEENTEFAASIRRALLNFSNYQRKQLLELDEIVFSIPSQQLKSRLGVVKNRYQHELKNINEQISNLNTVLQAQIESAIEVASTVLSGYKTLFKTCAEDAETSAMTVRSLETICGSIEKLLYQQNDFMAKKSGLRASPSVLAEQPGLMKLDDLFIEETSLFVRSLDNLLKAIKRLNSNIVKNIKQPGVDESSGADWLDEAKQQFIALLKLVDALLAHQAWLYEELWCLRDSNCSIYLNEEFRNNFEKQKNEQMAILQSLIGECEPLIESYKNEHALLKAEMFESGFFQS